MNTIRVSNMVNWPPERTKALLDWMVEQGVSPKQCAEITLNDDGTFDAVIFVLTPDGKRQLDPEDPGKVRTVVINYTPTTPCPEPTSND